MGTYFMATVCNVNCQECDSYWGNQALYNARVSPLQFVVTTVGHFEILITHTVLYISFHNILFCHFIDVLYGFRKSHIVLK